jgi:hypothetical protein
MEYYLYREQYDGIIASSAYKGYLASVITEPVIYKVFLEITKKDIIHLQFVSPYVEIIVRFTLELSTISCVMRSTRKEGWRDVLAVDKILLLLRSYLEDIGNDSEAKISELANKLKSITGAVTQKDLDVICNNKSANFL